jgi:hypothetical protein
VTETLTVAAAAILGHNGDIWSLPRPARHHHVIKFMAESGEPTPINGEQGFVLSDGRFVMRKAAAYLALKNGQIKSLKWPPNLYSEDIW